jgi:hypothetical protein
MRNVNHGPQGRGSFFGREEFYGELWSSTAPPTFGQWRKRPYVAIAELSTQAFDATDGRTWSP